MWKKILKMSFLKMRHEMFFVFRRVLELRSDANGMPLRSSTIQSTGSDAKMSHFMIR
jgi:hypothetical protein